jgi:hypothetical protein
MGSDSLHHSAKGDKISFETKTSNIHKLMFEETCITDDDGKKIGLDILEIEPIDNDKMLVTAVIKWVESDDPESPDDVT